MTVYRVIYANGTVVNKTSPYMPIEECKKEMTRFNSLPLLDLERQAMNAYIEGVEI